MNSLVQEGITPGEQNVGPNELRISALFGFSQGLFFIVPFLLCLEGLF
jgi:hypothetical protein